MIGLQAQAMPGVPAVPIWMWVVFAATVIIVMALDLGVFHRQAHRVGFREALAWVCVWVILALLFNLGILLRMGSGKAMEFLQGYVVELGLSVDNLFVFVVIFSYFSVRPEHQHRVLFWGILGAVAMRMAFIFLGIALVTRFHWLLYVFGAILFYTGVRLFAHEPEVKPERNLVLRLARKWLPVSPEFHGERFFIRERPGIAAETPSEGGGQGTILKSSVARRQGRLVATPLLLVLLLIEATDVVFAVDSVPAILLITLDPFIAYTSNIFAILGLRSMYFLLAGILDKFHYLRYGLSLVLIFIGSKMLLEHWVKVPAHISLFILLGLLGGSIALSILFPPKRQPLEPEPEGHGGTASEDD